MNLAQAENLAKSLMNEHGLYTWKFAWINRKTAFGLCNYSTKTISLSRHLVTINDMPRVKNTILHEIAHALAPGHGHGRVWKNMCVKIGARPERCYNEQNTVTPEAKYHLVCRECDFKASRHRKPTVQNYMCPKCLRGRPTRRYDVKYRLQLVQNY